MFSRAVLALAACAAMSLGCYTEAAVGGADVVVTSAPIRISDGPVVYYGGRPHYWYGGRWYYRDGGGWRYHRHEPRELYEHRRRWRR
jgi:hypothetical protein